MIGPRGVTSTSSATVRRRRTAIASTWRSHGAHPSPSRTVPPGPSSSRKQSARSAPPAVIPHATRPLWPATSPGAPTKLAPTARQSGVRSCAR